MLEDSEYWMADYSTTQAERQSPEEVTARALRIKEKNKLVKPKLTVTYSAITEDIIKNNRVALARELTRKKVAKIVHLERDEKVNQAKTILPKLHSKRIIKELVQRGENNADESTVSSAYKIAINEIHNNDTDTSKFNSDRLMTQPPQNASRIAISTDSGMQIIDMDTGEVVKMQKLTIERLALRKAQLAEKIATRSQNQHATSSELYDYYMATNTSNLSKQPRDGSGANSLSEAAEQVNTGVKTLAEVKAIGNAKALAKVKAIAEAKARVDAKVIAELKATAEAKAITDAQALADVMAIAEAKANEQNKAELNLNTVLPQNQTSSNVTITEIKNEKTSLRNNGETAVTIAYLGEVQRNKAKGKNIKWCFGSILAGLLLIVIITMTGKQSADISETPKFSDYPAAAAYTGVAAKLVRDNPLAKNFRTRLGAVLSGSPVFAGEYNRADWGCGTSCSTTVFVNKRTGKVLSQTFGGEFGPYLVELKLDSGLIKAEGFVLDKDGKATDEYAEYFYRLEEEQLKLIQTMPIPKPADANHDGRPD